jgi:hypothetical protein
MSTATLATGTGWYDPPAEPSPATDDSAPVVLHEVPSWMGYLLWFDGQASCWVLDLRDGDELTFFAENRTLSRADDVAAKEWTAAYDTRTVGEPPTWVWRCVTVCGKTGWTPIEDLTYRGNAMYHDLHTEPAASIDGCCTWLFDAIDPDPGTTP